MDTLGSLEQVALLAVWRLQPEAYGGNIRREIERRGGRRLSISAIYVTLMRLEKKGYARSTLGDARAVPGGKARRLFELTDDGRDALLATRSMLSDMWEGLEPSGSER